MRKQALARPLVVEQLEFEDVRACQTARYRKMVDRFIAIAREHPGACRPIAELCQIAGLHHRTLLRAFGAIHRATPYRYLQALRLDEARQVLLSETNSETVTQIAMRFGFRELGRFAADYRAAFGESPSQTLRSATAVKTEVDLHPNRTIRSN